MRVGFLGAGLIATFHSKMIRRSGVEVERAGVHDPDTDRAARFAAASGSTSCASEEELLDGCDAVYVCTWTSEHPRLVAAAVERGLAVFCEKPLATSLAEAEAMATVVGTAGVTNQVGLILRRSPAFVWARHLVEAPAAGRVMAIVFRDDQYLPVQGMYGSTWRGERSKAGAGTLLEHSIHDLDMLRFLAGDVTSVSAHDGHFHGLDGIEDAMAVTARFASGTVGSLTSVWHDNLARPSLRRVEVLCERRWVAIDGDDWWGPVTWTDTDGSSGRLEGEALAAAATPLFPGSPNPDAAFLDAAKRREATWPDFQTAVDAHRVADAVYRSAAAGGAPCRPEPRVPDRQV
jgi:myo-inositol 2-dehydrogenase/D-chiro-inositol 1-dehydrogenase